MEERAETFGQICVLGYLWAAYGLLIIWQADIIEKQLKILTSIPVKIRELLILSNFDYIIEGRKLNVGAQNLLLQSIVLWHAECFELKDIGRVSEVASF